jgi:restriction system protein
MPEIPDYQTLMLPVLRIAAEGETTVPRVVERLAEQFALKPEQLAERIPSGRSALINSRTHWAKTYLLQAGLLEQPRRSWFGASARGREVLSKNPTRIDKEYLLQFPEFKEFLQRSSASHKELSAASLTIGSLWEPTAETDASGLPPDERIDQAAVEIEAALRDELLERIFAIEPTQVRAAFFEQMVIQLLLAMGYGSASEKAGLRLGKSGDGGVDGVIHLDTLGIDRVYIQAKCYAQDRTIGAGVRDFSGALDHLKTSRGVFITTAQFTSDAKKYVSEIQKQIVLVDGRRLAELMIQHGVGVRTDRVVQIKRLDEDFFDDE